MKSLVILLILSAFSIFAAPVHGSSYLTEAQKELLLEKSSALGSAINRGRTQSPNEQNDQFGILNIKSLPRTPSQTSPRTSRQTTTIYIGWTSTNPALPTSTVPKNQQPQSQSFQSLFKNTDWGTPAYSNHSAEPIKRFATATESRDSTRKSQKTGKKSRWAGFFKGLSEFANAVNNGMSQTNSQYNPYNFQQTYPTPQLSNFAQPRSTQLIHTMKVGNQTINLGGDYRIRAINVGNQAVGTINDQKFRQINVGNTSTIWSGNSKKTCTKAGNMTICK